MSESALTQETIDHGEIENDGNGTKSLYAKAKEHPVVAGAAVLAGAGLAYAAVKAVQSAADSVAREVHFETSVLVNKPPDELYEYWRDFQHLPLFMKNLESVSCIDRERSHWVAKSLNGAPVEWDAEIFNEIPNQLIAWRSREDADLVHAGTIRFEEAPGDRGTYVRVTMNYNPLGGTIGASLAKLFGSEPSQLVRDDFRRFKQLMETGEIAGIDGQSSGRAEEAEPIVTDKSSTEEMQ